METVIRADAGRSVLSLVNPMLMARSLWAQRELIAQLARREIAVRYRNAWLGWLWAVLTPLVLLAIYTFVFAVVFKARWGEGPGETPAKFALTMFCGMLVFNLFAEVANRSATLLADNANYVKKVVFPLEVFVASALLSSLFNLLVSFGVWLIGWGVIMQTLPQVTVLWLPLVLLPICLVTLGVGWMLATLGVFIRDVGHAVLLFTQLLFFATTIFYPIERVPPKFQIVMRFNPLTHAVEDARRVMMDGLAPDWRFFIIALLTGVVVTTLGYALFIKSKRAFADVL